MKKLRKTAKIIPKLDFISPLVDILPQDIFDDLLVADKEFLSRVGTRAMSIFSRDYIFEENGENFTTDGRSFYIKVISSRFKDKWKELNDLWHREYDPLKPFDIRLVEHYDETFEVLKDSSTTDTQDEMYGFNSVQPTPTDKGASTRNNEYKRISPHDRDYTRTGNIGNTSFQDLIKQEREVLQYQIIDVIYSDIASILCRGKYI